MIIGVALLRRETEEVPGKFGSSLFFNGVFVFVTFGIVGIKVLVPGKENENAEESSPKFCSVDLDFGIKTIKETKTRIIPMKIMTPDLKNFFLNNFA